eukprot:CAMPEP_0170143336 /NCGR_PEP_ID=MMETSP0033_2-20121228/10355_1 /TAXON_ID=195969 /ORGANISM="Dolichomastix tenuilepis, Strain CCMP3274" /LENGTH=436 /DNA_ID=CAMNT_0010379783 /DNA_START=126 /DNA_END=1436 /DNA_ORIENTATION=+
MAWRTYSENDIASSLQWSCFMLSFFLFFFYGYQVYRKTCGWEVLYISAVEMVKYIIEIWWEKYSPATVTLSNGNEAAWLRYSEWLLTCPVILIALSRIGTADGTYSKRTMQLLTSDQGTIIMGITAALSSKATKVIFFLVGLCYGFNTFYTAAAVYLEAWKNVPEECKNLVKVMAYCFYSSWIMFPVLFILGPEGAGHITHDGSVIGHTIADLLSKNLWGILDWWLDYQLKMRLEMEMDDDNETEGEEDTNSQQMSTYKGKGASMRSESGDGDQSVVLVLDGSGTLTTFFQQQLSNVPVNVMAASSPEEVQTLASQGKGDFVLVPGNTELIARMKQNTSLPLVAVVEAGRPPPTGADEVVELPMIGQPYDNQHLINTFWNIRERRLAQDPGRSNNADVVALVSQLRTEVVRLKQELQVVKGSTSAPSEAGRPMAYI